MPRRVVTVSYTGLDAPGGVPKFNRDLHAAFPDRACAHFCWADFPWAQQVDQRGESEWGRARLLNEYLLKSRLIDSEDVVVADGFWALGLEYLRLAVSHSHGIWSHLTRVDVLAGKQPDMPAHHAAQVSFRQRWTGLRKHLTAVSDFIADEMEWQWGFRVDRVINNGVDTGEYRPRPKARWDRPIVVHGVNDRGNLNKGWDHISLLSSRPDIWVVSLDELHSTFNSGSPEAPWSKAETLGSANVFVHPSGFEGNSMMVAEALSSGLPFVGYDVGFAHWMARNLPWKQRIGAVMSRTTRSPEQTLRWVEHVLSQPSDEQELMGRNSRAVACEHLSIERFVNEWRKYVEEIER